MWQQNISIYNPLMCDVRHCAKIVILLLLVIRFCGHATHSNLWILTQCHTFHIYDIYVMCLLLLLFGNMHKCGLQWVCYLHKGTRKISIWIFDSYGWSSEATAKAAMAVVLTAGPCKVLTTKYYYQHHRHHHYYYCDDHCLYIHWFFSPLLLCVAPVTSIYYIHEWYKTLCVYLPWTRICVVWWCLMLSLLLLVMMMMEDNIMLQ